MKIKIRQSIFEDAESVTRVHVRAWQESYKGIIAQSYLENISYEERLKGRCSLLRKPPQTSIHLVVLHNEKIVGFCDAGKNRNHLDTPGEIYAIYLLKKYKNLGIGSSLMQLAKEHLIKNQLMPFTTWVLEDNKVACSFYEKHGGKKHQEIMLSIGDESFKEVAYIFT